MKIDIDLVAQHMRETAAAVILPRFRALDAAEVREKSGPKDLVTIADLEAEARLTPLLQDLLPGSVVVGEEACEKDRGGWRCWPVTRRCGWSIRSMAP